MRPGTAVEERNDVPRAWLITLGQKHGARVRAAEQAAVATHDGGAARAAECLKRWVHIAGAMTRVVGEYNVAFGSEALRVSEDRSDPAQPVLTIVQVGGSDVPSLVAALEGTLVTVRSRDGQGLSYEAECAIVPDRDNERTAAYILQPWLERL